MGEALITRRGGGGGLPTKATDVTSSVVTSGENHSFTLDTSKMYLARLSNSDDEYTALLIVTGSILVAAGVMHGEYGVSDGVLYGDYDGNVQIYFDKIYLLE